jgi:hypothetical protein
MTSRSKLAIIYSEPDGGRGTFDGSHGSMKPKVRRTIIGGG